VRTLKQEELELLTALLSRVPMAERPHPGEHILAVDLKDGGMGSIRIVTERDNPARRMGRELVSANYVDEDGVLVSISLNLDEDGKPFEIDMWKVDFSPLRRFPRPDDLRYEHE
jgi:hypothetical protein